MRKKARKTKGAGRDIGAIMRGNKGADTRPELALRRMLRERGLLGYRVHPKGLIGKPDVVYTRWMVAVFVHGCFWHDCPVCAKARPRANAAFWSEKIESNKRRDDLVRASLEEAGYAVVVIWEHEITFDLPSTVECVKAALESAGRHNPSIEDE